MKKLFALLIAALLWATVPAQVYASDKDALDASIEQYYKSLPQAKRDYKIRPRPILIQGAMNIETDALVRSLKKPVAYRYNNYLFVAGTYRNYPIVVSRTEQGLANAAASTIVAIEKFNPIAVINQGTAGGSDPSVHVGDIVIGAKSIPSSAIYTQQSPAGAGVDYTAQEMRGVFAYDRVDQVFKRRGEFFADKTLLNIAKKVAESEKEFTVATGTIASADWWMSWVDYVNFLREKYGITASEMETVSVAQICHNANIPFIGIRVISDNDINDEDYRFDVSDRSQKFSLLVAERYILDVLRK